MIKYICPKCENTDDQLKYFPKSYYEYMGWEYVDNYCANNDDPGCGGDCPFSSEDYCYEYAPYCDIESPDYDPVYCGEGTAHYCLEDGSDDEGCTWLVDACAAGQESEELCNAFENFDHELLDAAKSMDKTRDNCC